MFELWLVKTISNMLMSSIAPLYTTFYIDRFYGECQIVDYCFHNYPYIYKTLILQFQFNKGYIAREEDIISPVQKDRTIKKKKDNV